jgi:AraC family transcriptional regulator
LVVRSSVAETHETQLFTSALFTITEFACPPTDEAWTTSNLIRSRSPLVVFPRTAVGIRPATGRRVLATPNLVMLYNPSQEYERELRDTRGDSCLYFELHSPAVEALERASGVLADGQMTETHLPSSHAAYLRQHLMGRYLRSQDVDELFVEETAMRLVGGILEQRPARGRGKSTTTAGHYELSEAAKEGIVASISESLGLAQLASRLGVSPFHLARIFRTQTGFTLHQYRKQLRLRFALERLGDESSLSMLACDLGFASHSHFTDAFSREFGVAPSAVRGRDGLLLLRT